MAEAKLHKFKKKSSLGFVFLLIGLALITRWAVLEPTYQASDAMVPTLLSHEIFLVNKIRYGLRLPFSEEWIWVRQKPMRGETVALINRLDPGPYYIRRIIGVPGDRIDYKGGQISINNELVDRQVPVSTDFSKDEYVRFTELLGSHRYEIQLRRGEVYNDYPDLVVPEGHYFVMADNRTIGADSRNWGFVPEQNIIGRASVVVMSCDHVLFGIDFLCNPLSIRFKRLFAGVP